MELFLSTNVPRTIIFDRQSVQMLLLIQHAKHNNLMPTKKFKKIKRSSQRQTNGKALWEQNPARIKQKNQIEQ